MTSRFNKIVGVALLAGMAVLTGCGSSPTSTTTTSEQSRVTKPVMPATMTTTTTNQQMQHN